MNVKPEYSHIDPTAGGCTRNKKTLINHTMCKGINSVVSTSPAWSKEKGCIAKGMHSGKNNVESIRRIHAGGVALAGASSMKQEDKTCVELVELTIK